MTLNEAIVLARLDIKVTHEYFTDTEYMTMKGNMCIFECGTQIMLGDWSENKDYLLNGWKRFEKEI